MEDINKINEVKTPADLTIASLAGDGARPALRVVGGSSPGSVSSSGAGTATVLAMDEPAAPLLMPDEARDFRALWDAIQVGFVDEPRQAVQQADALVAAATKRLAEMFAVEREKLESQWDRGDDVSTENLRLALRRYRSFFSRLLSM